MHKAHLHICHPLALFHLKSLGESEAGMDSGDEGPPRPGPSGIRQGEPVDLAGAKMPAPEDPSGSIYFRPSFNS